MPPLDAGATLADLVVDAATGLVLSVRTEIDGTPLRRIVATVTSADWLRARRPK